MSRELSSISIEIPFEAENTDRAQHLLDLLLIEAVASLQSPTVYLGKEYADIFGCVAIEAHRLNHHHITRQCELLEDLLGVDPDFIVEADEEPVTK